MHLKIYKIYIPYNTILSYARYITSTDDIKYFLNIKKFENSDTISMEFKQTKILFNSETIKISGYMIL